MGDHGDIYETMAFYKSEEEFYELERAMVTAIQHKPKSKPQRPSLVKEPSDQKIEKYLKIGQDAYDSNELSTLSQIYGVLLKMQVDWIPLVKSRVALGEAFIGTNIINAHKLAVESYQEHPEEVDAYFAMAQVMSMANSPFQARQWFDLYKKGAQTVLTAHLEFEKRIDHEVRSFCRAEDSILQVLTTPKAFENVKELPYISKLLGREALESVKRIQENPCVETWRREFGQSKDFRFLALRLGYIYANMGLKSFHVMNEQELSQSLLETGGVFSKWDQKLVAHLCLFFTDCSFIPRMQQTCRPLRQMFDHQSVWAVATGSLRSAKRIPVVLSPGMPSKFFDDMHLSTTKSLFKAFHFCSSFLARWFSQTEDDLDPEPSTNAIATFRSLIETYNYGLFGTMSPYALLMSRVVDLLALDENSTDFGYNFSFIKPLLTRSALTDSLLSVCLLDYTSMMTLRYPDPSFWVPYTTTTIFPQTSSDIERACATLAALESADWMKQFDIQCLTPSSVSTNILGASSSIFDFEGLYHIHLHYTRVNLHGCHETGILELSSGEDGKFNGKGFDTIGKFHFDACPISPAGPFSWNQSYEDGTMLQFFGTLQPSGFGGYVTNPSHPDSSIIAYWFMCKDKSANSAALSEKFAEAVRVDKQKKQTWAINNPLKFVQGKPSHLDRGRALLNRLIAELEMLETPQIPTTILIKIRKQLPPWRPKYDAEVLKGVYETDSKYKARKEAYLKLRTRCYEIRQELFRLCQGQLLEVYLILKNPEHPRYATTFSKMIYIFTFRSPSSYQHLLQSLRQVFGSLENRTVGRGMHSELVSGALQRIRKLGNLPNTPSTTLLSFAAIGVAVFSVGVFLVGRALNSRTNHNQR